MLTLEWLLKAASKEAELDDFGDDRFHEPLRTWLDSAVSEGQLSPTGVAMLEATFIRFLVNRLRYQRDVKLHPEILDERVDRGPRRCPSGCRRVATTDFWLTARQV